MEKIYLLKYYDNDDDFKDVICAFDGSTNFKDENVRSSIKKMLDEAGIIDENIDDESAINELIEAICEGGEGYIASYQLWIDKCEFFK